MPPLANVPNVVKLELRQTDLTGLPLGSRVFWKYSGGPPTSAQCAALAASILTAVGTNFLSMIAAGDIENEVTVTDLSSDSGGIGSATGTGSGTRDGGSLPIGTAAVLDHLIARRYRGGKCRTYAQWGVATDYSSQAAWGADFVTAANAAWAGFSAALDGLTEGTTVLVNQVNISYFSGYTVGPANSHGYAKKIPTPRAVPVVDDVTGTACATVIGSQRRRYRR
jgi:hypothetical protein